MYKFNAFTLDGTTYINEKFTYKSGEILTWFLNYDEWKLELLEETYDRIHNQFPGILFPHNYYAREYKKKLSRMQANLEAVDEIATEIPPYNKIIHISDHNRNVLIDLVDRNPHLFKPDNAAKKGDYFVQDTDSHRRDEIVAGIHKYDAEISGIINNYIRFCDSIMRVHYTFKPFLDEYIHTGSTPPSQEQIAANFQKFSEGRRAGASNKQLISTGDLHVTNKVFAVGKSHILCEVREYSDLSAFLYDELMQGLKTGLLPKKCHNCGRYFLLTSGYYPDFCERKAPGEKGKTCRDVGAKKKFDDKVKSDPIWLTYQRAYKTHYARYMKKKMTQAEFLAWSNMAIELREKALNKEIKYEDYYEEIRK